MTLRCPTLTLTVALALSGCGSVNSVATVIGSRSASSLTAGAPMPPRPAGPPPAACQQLSTMAPLNSKSVVKAEAPKWSVASSTDPSCPVRNVIDAQQSTVAVVAPPDTSAIRATVEWMLAAAEQMEPAPRFRLNAVKAKAEGETLAVTGSVLLSDEVNAVPETLRNGFLQAVETLVRTDAPADSPVLCIDMQALATRLGSAGRLREPIKVRVPRAALESVAQTQLSLTRTGIVSIDTADGYTLAETRISWPTLLHSRPAAECGCDLLLEAEKPRTEARPFDFAFSGLALAKIAPKAFVHLRFTQPGEPVRRIAVVEPAETKPDTGNALVDLMASAYAPTRLSADMMSGRTAKLNVGGWTLDMKAIAQFQGAQAKLADADVAERLCFRGDGAALVAIPLSAKQWQQWSGGLGGIESVQRTVVLDLKRAGLAESGAVAVDLDAAGRGVLQKVLAQGASANWTVRLNKQVKRESAAFLKLPTERADGKQELLKVRVELSSDIVLAQSDVAVMFESAVGTLAIPIKDFPSPAGVYAALTNVWGGPKKSSAAGSVFTLEGEPRELELRVGGRGLARNFMVLATDGKGGTLDAVQGAVAVPIAVDRVISPQCSLIVSASDTARSAEVQLATDLPAGAVKTLEVYDLQRSLVRFKQGAQMLCEGTNKSNCVAATDLIGR